eukprot:SM000719S21279  [mRNA]  locus=s719:433:990:+ [translate_table: standard]
MEDALVMWARWCRFTTMAAFQSRLFAITDDLGVAELQVNPEELTVRLVHTVLGWATSADRIVGSCVLQA